MRRSIRQLLTYFISCIYRFTCTAPCTPSCQNGGLCVARDVCKCPAEYMGEQCQYPLCRPPCINGGDCVRPNVCMCPAAWKGNRCQMPVCHLPCLNGGKYVFLSKKIRNAHFQEHTGQTLGTRKRFNFGRPHANLSRKISQEKCETTAFSQNERKKFKRCEKSVKANKNREEENSRLFEHIAYSSIGILLFHHSVLSSTEKVMRK